jgi:radical SAM protein with 4Fe4S-binding SPASM domain
MLLDDPNFVSKTPLVVKWEVTKRCNLRCAHCYASAGSIASNDLSTEEALALIDRLSELEVMNIVFTGGEPFIRRDFQRLIDETEKHAICIDILTNGTMITEYFSQFLARVVPHSVQVSLDGATAETHDKFRGLKGSFDATVRGIENLVNAGVRVTVAATFHKGNIGELNKLVQLAYRLGAKGFLFGFIFPIGRGLSAFDTLALDRAEQRLVWDSLVRESSTRGLGSDFFVQVDEALGTIQGKDLNPPTCRAGRIMITIGANGDMIPCPMLFDYKLGNVRTDDLQEIWENSPRLRYLRDHSNLKGPCAECRLRDRCGGGCKAIAFLAKGDPMASDPYCLSFQPV